MSLNGFRFSRQRVWCEAPEYLKAIMSTDPLVVFTPSGKRGRFRRRYADPDCGTAAGCRPGFRLWRARDLFEMPDHPSYGEFSKHGVTVAHDALSEWNAVEQALQDKRGLKTAAGLAVRRRCRATW